MKLLFYPKLALTGIRKNGKLYAPYIMTCAGMITMFYILIFLADSANVGRIRGGTTMQQILLFGALVMAVFSLIFLLYTNAFLMRRRNKEFGLYIVLGMGKRNIARILAWETVTTAAVSFLAGSVFGIALSKLAEFGLSKLMEENVSYTFAVSGIGLLLAAACFAVIFAILYVNSLFRIRKTDPLALLKSENTGEKPPKGNLFFAISGLVILAAAYYISVSIEDPVKALGLFFIAVIMVIVATYLLFISGSVFFCRLLTKRKGFYYHPRNFVSVASMTYRMKRNGAGLASICILATMVLVMLSSTACLYFGKEDSIRSQYPRNIIASTETFYPDERGDRLISELREQFTSASQKRGASLKDLMDYRFLCIFGKTSDGILRSSTAEYFSGQDQYYIYFFPLSDYNSLTQSNVALNPDEVLLSCGGREYTGKTLSTDALGELTVKSVVEPFEILSSAMRQTTTPILYVVVPDFSLVQSALTRLGENSGGSPLVRYHWYFAFDTDASSETQISLQDDFRLIYRDRTVSTHEKDSGIYAYSVSSSATARADFYNSFGGLFFLGIILGLVFTVSAALIIYYKQISEGYEDQSRFDTMQKVGMTKSNIRKSVNSQMLMVFMLPLVTAGIHLSFAFPMIQKLLTLFSLTNARLLVTTTALSFLFFGLIYAIIYRLTSNAYCKIVSGIDA